MRVRLLVGMAGDDVTREPGEEMDFADDEAERLISAQFAVPVVTKKVERAVARKPREKR